MKLLLTASVEAAALDGISTAISETGLLFVIQPKVAFMLRFLDRDASSFPTLRCKSGTVLGMISLEHIKDPALYRPRARSATDK